MKQLMAPALFTQLELHVDPLAGGRASAGEEARTSVESKTRKPA
jgi:hypothetical protein